MFIKRNTTFIFVNGLNMANTTIINQLKHYKETIKILINMIRWYLLNIKNITTFIYNVTKFVPWHHKACKIIIIGGAKKSYCYF